MVYDVLIAGGGTAGCAAAYIAATKGLKTILIEKNIHLGGSITSALVIPAMKSSDNQINTNFFDALVNELKELGGQLTYSDGNPGWFNPELTKIALDRLMAKANVEVRFNTTITGVNIEKRSLNNIIIVSNMLSECIAARYFVDATGNCELGKLSGCEFLPDKNLKQPSSLRFIMSGINLNSFADWLEYFDTDREVTTVMRTASQVHLSTACTSDSGKKWALEPLFEDALTKNILKKQDLSYFQVFTIPNMPTAIAFNCPRLSESLSDTELLVEGREAILRLSEFVKAYFPGFKNAYISNIADMLGVRTSSRIKGKYIYTIDDLKSGKSFKTPAVIANYPVDVHSDDSDKSFLVKYGEYQLPVESLMSADFDNLFVAGRCLSADFLAQAALRIQPSCFSMGEAVAKFIAEAGN